MNKPISLKLIFHAGFGLLLIGCSTFTTTSDKDPFYDLSTLDIYSWIETAKGSVPEVKNAAVIQSHAPIVIDKILRSKGYRFNKDPLKADFVVSSHVTSKQKIDISDVPLGMGYNAKNAKIFLSDREYTQGTLIVDFLSVSKKGLIWRGTASTPITPGYEPAAVKKILDDAVAAVLKKFPSRK